jgi:copper transport protein
VLALPPLRPRLAPWSSVLFALLGSALLVTISVLPAEAHAMLVESDPADRSRPAEAPDAVRLTFNEPVDVATDGIRVFDGSAQRVDTGGWSEDASAEVVGVDLPADLPDGGYVVTYRVRSADSHPIAGAFSFTVGEGEEVDDEVVADLFGGAGSEWTGVVGPALRGLSYLGVLVAAGAVLFAALVASSPRDRRSARWLGSRAAGLGGLATLLAVPVQAVAVTGRGVLEVLPPGGGVGDTLLASSFGQSTLLRIVGLSWLWLSWRFTVDDSRPGAGQHLPTALAGMIALGSYALDGHQRSVEPTWLLATADLVHLVGAAAWVGCLVLLAVAVRRRRIDDDPVGAARIVARFSTVALWSVLALALAGVAMSWVLVRSVHALTTTGYGWTLVAKLAAVALVLLVAVYNRQRLVPAVVARLAPAGGAVDAGPDVAGDRVADRSRAAWSQLRTTTLIEVVGIALVIGLTGFLVTQRPAAEAAGVTGAYEATTALTEEFDLDLVVDPNRAGLNALHLYVLDPTGRPAEGIEDLRLELHYLPEGIGPFEIEPFFAGPGHWTATIDELAFPGEWEFRVVVGVDRFTESTAEFRVVVNP